MGRLAFRFAPVVTVVALACSFDTGGMPTDSGPAESVGDSDADSTGIDSSVSASTTVSGSGTGTTSGSSTVSPTMTSMSTSSETVDPATDTETATTDGTTSVDASAYSQVISITDLAGAKVNNAQILVELSAETVRWDLIEGDLSNVTFYASAGGQAEKLFFDIDWITDEGADVWVLLPEVSPDFNEFTIQYGEGITEAPSDPADVWGAYEGVWHLNEDPEGAKDQFKDSSGNDHHLRNEASDQIPTEDMEEGIAGRAPRLAQGREIESDSWAGSSITGPFTMEGWALLESMPDDGFRDLIRKNNNYRLSLLRDTAVTGNNWDNPAGVVFEDNDPPVWRGATAPNTPSVNDWHYYVLVFESEVMIKGSNSSRSTLYIDGELVDERDWPAFVVNSSNSFVRLGSDVPGLIDEVRMAHVTRSPAWVDIQYRSMSRTLLEFGDPIPLR